jgi:hypothetical protein
MEDIVYESEGGMALSRGNMPSTDPSSDLNVKLA